MIRRSLRIGLRLALILGVVVGLSKILGARRTAPAPLAPAPAPPWPPLGTPTTAPGPTSAGLAQDRSEPETATASPSWVEPEGGACPAGYPVKAKLASKIFHLPGMGHYERTSPDRCYADAADAEADGFRAAKR